MRIIRNITMALCSVFSLGACAQTAEQTMIKSDMETIEAIEKRKTVRAYTDQPVEAEKIRTVVEAGNMAAGTPTVGKRYFVVINDKDLVDRIGEKAKEMMRKSPIPRAKLVGNNPNYHPTFNAPVLIYVCVDASEEGMMYDIATQNAAVAAGTMQIAATALGLGSAYIGAPGMAMADPELREECKIPDGYRVVSSFLLGYAVDNKPHAPRKNNPENIIYVK